MALNARGTGMQAMHTASEPRYQCPRCRAVVCARCDAYIHELLHVCPCCEDGGPGGGAGEAGQGESAGQKEPEEHDGVMAGGMSGQ